jgi:hypothetical protein
MEEIMDSEDLLEFGQSVARGMVHVGACTAVYYAAYGTPVIMASNGGGCLHDAFIAAGVIATAFGSLIALPVASYLSESDDMLPWLYRDAMDADYDGAGTLGLSTAVALSSLVIIAAEVNVARHVLGNLDGKFGKFCEDYDATAKRLAAEEQDRSDRTVHLQRVQGDDKELEVEPVCGSTAYKVSPIVANPSDPTKPLRFRCVRIAPAP